MHILISIALSLVLALHGLRKKSLTKSGALCALLVGIITLSNNCYTFTVVLFVFYFTGSGLTKYKAERKKQLEEDYQDGGQRTAMQVVCNAFTGTIICIIHQHYYGGQLKCLLDDRGSRLLFWMYIGHYSTCNGDTWASELGILNKGWPFLITTFKKVPPGTNGGVSPLGLFASVLGGLIIGISAMISIYFADGCNRLYIQLIPVASIAGLIGSIIDSILGATVQVSMYSEKYRKVTYSMTEETKLVSGYDLLDNNQ
ncbi:17901_t:CDS:2, partial [Cetraspora pellucida]